MRSTEPAVPEIDRPEPSSAPPPGARPESAALPAAAAALRDVVYRVTMRGMSAWALARHRRHFDDVERFCLFVGYPRSGHSVVGAMLNAHPDAVISHELDIPPLVLGGCGRDDLYAQILARAVWFHLRGNRSNYDYSVPNQPQGSFRRLRVVGDKRGGAVTRCLAEHPDFLARLRRLTGIPLRLVHVVRNPFDNIAAISLWHGLSLEDSVRFYFDHCAVTSRLGELCDAGELLTLRHEDLIGAPAALLVELCTFVGLEAERVYVDDCSRVVFRAPTQSRRRVTWPPGLRREVERLARSNPHLGGYDLDEPAA